MFIFSAMTSGVSTPLQQEAPTETSNSGATANNTSADGQQAAAQQAAVAASAASGQQAQQNYNYFTGSTEGPESPGGPTASLNQYSSYGRAMTQYMQEYNPYYGSSGQNFAPGNTGNSTASTTNGSDSPTGTTAAALANYYSGFGAAAASPYASYYNNLALAGYYPTSHQSTTGYAYPGTTSNASSGAVTGSTHHDDYNRRPGPVYQLVDRGVPPPNIVETGTNSLDDILKTPSKKKILTLNSKVQSLVTCRVLEVFFKCRVYSSFFNFIKIKLREGRITKRF